MPDDVRSGFFAWVSVVSWAVAGCHGGSHESGRHVAPRPESGPAQTAAVVPAESVAGPATGTPAPQPASAHPARPPAEWIAPFDMQDAGPAPSGANWGRCALHFTPDGHPALDAMRLGLMCGPSNGMRRVVLGPKQRSGGAGHVELQFPAHAGDCFRLLVVGEEGVGRIEVELSDAHGKLLAKQTGRRRWTMLGLDGPVCVPDKGQYHARVHAERGQLAVELWRLR